MTPSFSTGRSPPLCRYLWTSSRPVKTVPLSSTMSPARRLRTAASVSGVLQTHGLRLPPSARARSSGSGPVAVIAVELAGSLVQPLDDLALGVEDHAATAIGPAHVGHADEERRRQPIQRSDLAAADRQLAAEAHRADVELDSPRRGCGLPARPAARRGCGRPGCAGAVPWRIRSRWRGRRRCRRRGSRDRSPCPAPARRRRGCRPRTPSRSRSARLPLSVAGSEYWALMFSQPPPLRIRRTSTLSSRC